MSRETVHRFVRTGGECGLHFLPAVLGLVGRAETAASRSVPSPFVWCVVTARLRVAASELPGILTAKISEQRLVKLLLQNKQVSKK